MKENQIKTFSFWNRITGFLVFCISSLTYFLTMEQGVSWWDCGELIASAYKLEVCHPPGAPFFLLLGRFFSLFAPSPEKVAVCTNLLSVLSGAGTVMFLYWTITFIVRKIFCRHNDFNLSAQIAVIGAGLTGSLAFAFSDSFWFSSVETEVYSLSSFFTAVTFWSALQWGEEADSPHGNRWIVFIALLLGISIGVHLLNLLLIPVIALIIYFRYHKISLRGLLSALLIGCGILIVILKILIPDIPSAAFFVERLFVNSLHLPFHSGNTFFFLLLGAGLIGLIIRTHQRKQYTWNLILVCLMAFLIGASSYAIVLIRSSANLPINEFRPDNTGRLVSYLDREQYDSAPLFYGPDYSAPIPHYKNAGYLWSSKGPGYTQQGLSKGEKVYDSKFCTFFPRMYSSQPSHIKAYQEWGNITGTPITVSDQNGTRNILKPSFTENLRFFFKYQLNFMYFRYLMWNFSGRQNDIPGDGNAFDGNWITGFKGADYYPTQVSRSGLYMLPFLLGIIGICVSFGFTASRKKYGPILLLFFLITGPAIVVYLNQTPYQPRERDYAYLGSFYVFALWIGLGVFTLINRVLPYTKKSPAIAGIASLLLLGVPGLMFAENLQSHNRSGRAIVHDMARNYLESCAPNAILFTSGDNDTFPLWYLQEVERIRTDVRVCNTSLLFADWYCNQMRSAVNNSAPLKFGLSPDCYYSGSWNRIRIENQKSVPLDLEEALNFINREDSASMISDNGLKVHFIPAQAVSIKAPEFSGDPISKRYSTPMVLRFSKSWINKSDLAVLDLLQHNLWNRPVYFDKGAIWALNLDIGEYLRPEGFAFRMGPIRGISPILGGLTNINSDLLYYRLMHLFHWGNIDNPNILIDYTSQQEIRGSGAIHSFCLLAEKLFNEGQTKKAWKVLDKARSLFTRSEISDGYANVQIADAYFYCENPLQATALINAVSRSCFHKLTVLAMLKRHQTQQTNEKKREQLLLFHELIRISQSYRQASLTNQLEQMLISLSHK